MSSVCMDVLLAASTTVERTNRKISVNPSLIRFLLFILFVLLKLFASWLICTTNILCNVEFNLFTSQVIVLPDVKYWCDVKKCGKAACIVLVVIKSPALSACESEFVKDAAVLAAVFYSYL